MPIQPPALDDRSYDDLLAEMLANIPAHTPEWVSPDVGDPGRTLLELTAWLGDAILYRANLVPEKQRLTFLRLLGLPLRPAVPARGLVALTADPNNTEVIPLAPAATVAGPVVFETLGGLDLLPLVGQVFRKAPLTNQQKAEAAPLLTGLQTLYKLGAAPTGYYTQEVFSNDLGDPKGVDLATDTLDRSLWLALFAPKLEKAPEVRTALGDGDAQRILNVGFVPALKLADPFAEIGPRAAVNHRWQMTLAPGPDGRSRLEELKILEDTTENLTRAGILRLALPQAADIGAPFNDVRSDAQAGVGDKPPRIDDVDRQNRLVTWVRLQVPSALRVSWLGINAVEVDQRTSRPVTVVGVSDGSGDQQFDLPTTQVDENTLEIEVDMPGIGFQLWMAVDDLEVLPGPIPAYRLDPEAGRIFFGNNLRGLIPPAGRRIRARRLRSGGGVAGNLRPGQLTSITAQKPNREPVTQKVTVKQPVATSGGHDAETITEAERRIPAFLRHRERAVTVEDYRSLAMDIPGADVERVEVLPLFKPQNRASNVPGVVSVMVIPGKEDYHRAPCPRPDQPLLQTVFRALEPRKPVAAELYVIGVDYVGIAISVAVEVLAGFDLRVVSQEVEDALRRYLWPLVPGGTAQQGWPLGRHVRALELEVIVSQVPGVIEVNGMRLWRRQADGLFVAIVVGPGGQQEITLAPYQLPEVLECRVVAGPDGSGVKPRERVDPEGPTTGVAVPVVPKVC